jgi:hypothetical protein
MAELSPRDLRHFFIDEAGDSVLFGKRGQIRVGTEGCSHYFALGALQVLEPERLAEEFSDLRTSILGDPYFKDVPSLQPSARKTALFFHAKDDLPEIRRDVFSLLQKHDMKFFAVIRDKGAMLDEVRVMNSPMMKKFHPDYRYRPDSVYDDMVSRLFKGMLHKGDEYRITFAARGKKNRSDALMHALELSKERFRKKWGIESTAPISLMVASPVENACLQATDYFLWALQRLVERGEDRYWNLLWPQVRTVIDQDDTQKSKAGVYYTQKKPLDRAAWKSREGV